MWNAQREENESKKKAHGRKPERRGKRREKKRKMKETARVHSVTEKKVRRNDNKECGDMMKRKKKNKTNIEGNNQQKSNTIWQLIARLLVVCGFFALAEWLTNTRNCRRLRRRRGLNSRLCRGAESDLNTAPRSCADPTRLRWLESKGVVRLKVEL